MSRRPLFAIAIIVAIGAVVYSVTRPEPTSQEKLQDAAEKVLESAEDTVQAVTDVVNETADTVRQEVTDKADEIGAELSQKSAEFVDELNAATQESRDNVLDIVTSWKETGIVTEDGIDLDAAIATVDAAQIDDKVKSQLKALIEAVRDAPEKASAMLADLSAALSR